MDGLLSRGSMPVLGKPRVVKCWYLEAVDGACVVALGNQRVLAMEQSSKRFLIQLLTVICASLSLLLGVLSCKWHFQAQPWSYAAVPTKEKSEDAESFSHRVQNILENSISGLNI